MSRETILIIDDEPAVRESLASFLDDEGYQVFAAEDGDQGLDIFFKEKVDIVLTDLRMPIMDGIEVMQRIHRHSPDIPMVVVSGAGKRQDIIKALQMGAKDYITKPVSDLNMIRHVVEKALETKYLIDQNKEYRRRLEKSEARYRTITEQIAEGVFTVDAKGKISFCNPAFCRMTGYDAQTLLTMTLMDLAAQESQQTISQAQNPEGLAGRYEIQIIHQEGQKVHVELACSFLFDDQNRCCGAIALARDITKLVALRNQYLKYLKTDHSNHVVSICASCKSLKKEGAQWQQVEAFFSHIAFSHGICPDCCQRLYPDIDIGELAL